MEVCIVKIVIETIKDKFASIRAEIKGKGWVTFSYDKIYAYLVFLYQFKPRWGLYLIFGLLAGLALPPINFPFFLPLVFASIIRLTDFTDEPSDVFLGGFAFCFGFHLIGFYWIAFSLLSTPHIAFLMPFLVIGIPAVYAFFNSFVFLIYHVFSRDISAVLKCIFFASLWCGFEYLRGFKILPLPWNFIGYSVSFSDSMMQISSYIGVYGLSVLITTMCCLCHLVLLNGNKINYIGFLRIIFFVFIGVFLLWLWGHFRLQNGKFELDSKVRILMIQGNNESKNEWDESFRAKTFHNYLNKTLKHNSTTITHIIWPESSIPYVLEENSDIILSLKNTLLPNQTLMAGSVHLVKNTTTQSPTLGILKTPDFKLYNSILILNQQGDIGFYHKSKLVPFGEYIPFRGILPFIKKFTNGSIDFARGEGLQILRTTHTPSFIPLLCFESAFSGQTPRNFTKNKIIEPAFILNLTNDSWFWRSSGPFQHFTMAKFRAIEEGVPVIRSATTGVSAIIDPYGKVVKKIPLLKEGIIEEYLPKRLPYYTLFSFIGNTPALIFVILVILRVVYAFFEVQIASFIKDTISSFRSR